MRTRVELFAAIRRDARVEGLSIRELARRHGGGRPTVRTAFREASPPPRKPRVRSAPRLEPFKAAIDAMLVADTTAPRKQRHTARRVFARLIEEHAADELSYSPVRDYVRVRRAQIDTEAGRRVVVFVPQDHAPGAEAGRLRRGVGGAGRDENEVPHVRVPAVLLGLSCSGKAIHRVYPTQGQEAFLQGHVEAFEQIGGVPHRHIRYNNLTCAVSAVLYGTDRRRTENQRWVLFRSHYGFDAFYCQPGIGGAHEKGGVEGEVGRFRRTRLSPMPEVATLDELNQKIRSWEHAEDHRRIADRIRTVGQDFDLEQPLLAPLPVEAFDPGLVLNPRVGRSALVTVRMNKYSVPARLIGRRVRVSLRASEVVVFDGHTQAARHGRVATRGGCVVELDHYLEVLKIKPGALPGSTALAAARACGAFIPAHEAFWAASRKVNGDAEGTRQLIDVLLLHRSMPHEQVINGITAALAVGAVKADVVAVEARRHATAAVGGSGQDCHPALLPPAVSNEL